MGIRVTDSVFFDGQFWIALVERFEDDGGYAVARHVFGPEPNNAELLAWAGRGFHHLAWSMGEGEAAALPLRRANPKRAQREAGRELARTGFSPRAREALKRR